MADVIVSGEIEGRNEAEFRAVVSCPGPTGSIRGEMEVVINGREFEYTFHSTRPTRLIARRSGITRFIFIAFRRVTVHNLTSHFTTTGATLTLTARRSSTGRRTATLTIRRPGRITLRASGFLEEGRTSVFRAVNCT
jgi:hypothetical protein